MIGRKRERIAYYLRNIILEYFISQVKCELILGWRLRSRSNLKIKNSQIEKSHEVGKFENLGIWQFEIRKLGDYNIQKAANLEIWTSENLRKFSELRNSNIRKLKDLTIGMFENFDI